ncbi:sulfur carrier protein ThiS adenylyltransferase ThiF [Veillonella magna]|uniref:sulfur carrier protein ThiS adenylyltransferase ThiF n=1 Tax=Veillonella magna TaxID=464322 RepID=UPI00266637D8|nr:sulfur carrier protein ThiS adenylyltransferase ThiF [Veillonella magna]
MEKNEQQPSFNRMYSWPPLGIEDTCVQRLWQALCSRHGREAQEQLAEAHVAVAGLGGLGSNIAVQLTRIGIGKLTLLDFDRVDITNLNRQHYFLHHVGQYKTEALRKILAMINPGIQITCITDRLTASTVIPYLQEANIICEAFDVADQKAMLVREVRRQLPETTIVSGNGMAGYGRTNDMCVKRLGRHLYLCGDGHSGTEGKLSVMAPRVVLCASQMANVVTSIVLGGREI